MGENDSGVKHFKKNKKRSNTVIKIIMLLLVAVLMTVGFFRLMYGERKKMSMPLMGAQASTTLSGDAAQGGETANDLQFLKEMDEYNKLKAVAKIKSEIAEYEQKGQSGHGGAPHIQNLRPDGSGLAALAPVPPPPVPVAGTGGSISPLPGGDIGRGRDEEAPQLVATNPAENTALVSMGGAVFRLGVGDFVGSGTISQITGHSIIITSGKGKRVLYLARGGEPGTGKGGKTDDSRADATTKQ